MIDHPARSYTSGLLHRSCYHFQRVVISVEKLGRAHRGAPFRGFGPAQWACRGLQAGQGEGYSSINAGVHMGFPKDAGKQALIWVNNGLYMVIW